MKKLNKYIGQMTGMGITENTVKSSRSTRVLVHLNDEVLTDASITSDPYRHNSSS